MIQPAEVKTIYGFRDANEKEDILTLSLLNTIHPFQVSKMKQAIELLSPVLLAVLCVFVGLYSYKNDSGIGMMALPLCILLVYIPKVKESLDRRLNSSGIRHDPERLGTHFLLGFGVCTEKKVVSSGIRRCYLARVRLQGGKVMENILMIREEFDQLKEGQRLVVAVADSPEAEQYVGILPSLYNSRLSRETGEKGRTVQKPDSGSMRPISDQEREYCAAYYERMRKALFGEQHRNRIFVFLISAVLVAVISFVVGVVFFLDLAMVLAAGYLFMSLSDVWETRSVVKELRTAQDLLVVDARVADKPVLESDNKRAKGRTQAIDFADRTGRLVFRSPKYENRKLFEIGDEVLLVYRGKKTPLPCKKIVKS